MLKKKYLDIQNDYFLTGKQSSPKKLSKTHNVGGNNNIQITGVWYWKKWYDRIFRWKTVRFFVGQDVWEFRRGTWSIQKNED